MQPLSEHQNAAACPKPGWGNQHHASVFERLSEIQIYTDSWLGRVETALRAKSGLRRATGNANNASFMQSEKGGGGSTGAGCTRSCFSRVRNTHPFIALQCGTAMQGPRNTEWLLCSVLRTWMYNVDRRIALEAVLSRSCTFFCGMTSRGKHLLMCCILLLNSCQ